MKIKNSTDAELVTATLDGSREAFGILVERHQQFVCALAYSKTGSVAAAEDIAQDAFLSAWKNLAALRAPENFRGWLCGTVRNLAVRFHGRRGVSVPLTDDIPAAAGDEIMMREEEAIVWTTLEQMPETYRDPFVLFYRGGQSAREVAAALGLTEEAVKQRLSRGRTMLREAVREKVESALVRARPGAAFTAAVLATLPAITSTAQAAGTGIAVAKGAGSFSLATLAGPFLGMMAGFLGAWFGMKCSLDRAETERERRFVRQTAVITMAGMAAMTAGLLALLLPGRDLLLVHPWLWTALMLVLILGFMGACFVGGTRRTSQLLKIRAEERGRRGLPTVGTDPLFFEYRSRTRFLGLPLVHVCLGSSMRHVACGWIAYGNVAVAPLLAVGGIAIGGVSMGGLAAGLVTTAGIGLGLLSFAGLSLGAVAIGGLAIGWIAIGGSAVGGLAVMAGAGWAGLYAIGHNVAAPHAGDAAARAFFNDYGLVQGAAFLVEYGWLLQIAVLLPMTAMCLWVRSLRRRSAQAAAVSSIHSQ